MMWIILLVFLWWFIIRFMAGAKEERTESKSFDALRREVETPENKERITDLILFHNRRMLAGAVGRESLARLVRELKELGGKEEETPEDLF